MHAYAIYLHQHEDQDDAITAGVIHDLDPRILLAKSMQEPSESLFSALRRCEPAVHTMAFYRTLDGFLKTEFSDELMDCPVINTNVLRFFNLVRRWHLDPLVVAAHRSLNYQMNRATAFSDVLGIMRAVNVLNADEIERRILHGWKKSLYCYIDRRLQRVVSPLAFNLVSPLVQVRDAKHLNRLARKFENCLNTMDHRVRLASGNYLLVHLAEGIAERPEGAVAVLELGAGGIWYISDAEYARSVECPPEVRNRIVELLGQSGVKAAPRTYTKAMRFFANAPDLMSW